MAEKGGTCGVENMKKGDEKENRRIIVNGKPLHPHQEKNRKKSTLHLGNHCCKFQFPWLAFIDCTGAEAVK